MVDGKKCPLQAGDIIRCADFSKAWRDRGRISTVQGELTITGGSVWLSHSETRGFVQEVQLEHRLSDAERVEIFNRTGAMGPESEMRTVRISRAVAGPRNNTVVVNGDPTDVRDGVWFVEAVEEDLTAVIGEALTQYHFLLVTDNALIDRVDAAKSIRADAICVLPRRGAPIFKPWAVSTKMVLIPAVGTILSGAELRWYMADADPDAEYIVTELAPVMRTISVCGNSSTPRDCRDEWCGIRHSHKEMEVLAGTHIHARKVRMDDETGLLIVLEGEICWFRAQDRDWRDSDFFDGKSIHVGGDRDGNYFFVS